MIDSPNRIVIKQGTITAIVDILTIAGSFYGASKPEQPQTSANNQAQILNNQSAVIFNQEFIKTKLATLGGNQTEILKALDKVGKK